ncbi:hypothetical protein ACFSTD_22895 [Novosphingobium colocasiae]
MLARAITPASASTAGRGSTNAASAKAARAPRRTHNNKPSGVASSTACTVAPSSAPIGNAAMDAIAASVHHRLVSRARTASATSPPRARPEKERPPSHSR